MYNKYTDKLRKVFQIANQKAQQVGQEFINVPLLYWGMLEEGTNQAVIILKNLEVDTEKLKITVKENLPYDKQKQIVGTLPWNDLAQLARTFAQEQAELLGHDHVGCAHLLLALIKLRQPIPVSFEEVKAEIKRLFPDSKDKVILDKETVEAWIEQCNRLQQLNEQQAKELKKLKEEVLRLKGV